MARLARSQDKEREKGGFNQINTNPPSPSKQPASRAWAEQNKTEKDPVSLSLLSFPNLQTSLASFCTGNMSKHTGKFHRQTDPQKTSVQYGPNQRYKTNQTELPASVGRACGKSPLDPMSRCRCIVAWCDAGVAVAGDGSAASPRCLLAATLRRYPPVPLGTIPLQSVFHLATAIGMVSLAHSPRPLPSVLFCVYVAQLGSPL